MGPALVIGAAIAYVARLPTRLVAAVMAFGGGVLISVLSFELMDEAYRQGGFTAAAIGFLAGAAVYAAANVWISWRGGKNRKHSGGQQQSAEEGNGLAIAVGALLDEIPESVVIGVNLLTEWNWCQSGRGDRDLPLELTQGVVAYSRHEGRRRRS